MPTNEKKIIPLSRLTREKTPKKNIKASGEHLDTVKYQKKTMGSRERGMEVLMSAERCWAGMYQFRANRERCKRYTYGDQWSDLIEVDGNLIKEEDYLREQGCIPLKNNFLRRMVRNVLGAFASQTKEPMCFARDREEQSLGETMSTVLQCNMQANKSSELNARAMEEFLIGGFVVQKKTVGWRNDRFDCWTDNVSPSMFIVDSAMHDPRGWDASLVGELHDVPFDELINSFASSPSEFKRLSEIYHEANQLRHNDAWQKKFGESCDIDRSFFVAGGRSLCRVIEVWRKERKPRLRCIDKLSGDSYKIELSDYQDMVVSKNDSRLAEGAERGIPKEDIPLIECEWFSDSYWYYYFLSPCGDILAEGETPYDHGEHPYVFKGYPFIDGEIHSLVGDSIDQQRYINRTYTLYDMTMRSSAKGALLYPIEALPDDMSPEDVAANWSRPNSVFFFKGKELTHMPQQVNAAQGNSLIGELLSIQMKFFEDISGVNGAMQGKPGHSGMAASLYAQQAQNAATSLIDLFNAFSSFVIAGAYKDVQNIQQFYDEKRVFSIAGSDGSYVTYDPSRIRSIVFDISIVESPNAPVFRAYSNDMLLKFWDAGEISAEQVLEVGDFPFADKLLQSIRASKERAAEEQGAMPGVLPPKQS